MFFYVDLGAAGQQSDSCVFKETRFYNQLNNGTLYIPNCPISNFPLCLLADKAIPLRTNLMRSYPGRVLNNRRVIFNYRFSRATRTTEAAFGILVSHWRVPQGTLSGDLALCENIFPPTTCPHNFLFMDDACPQMGTAIATKTERFARVHATAILLMMNRFRMDQTEANHRQCL